MAVAALAHAAEDYMARCLVITGVATVEQLSSETGDMAAVAWSQGLGRLLRNFHMAVKGPSHSSLDEEPVHVRDLFRRIDERAALYRLGEMR
jgi:hypothetical protein